MNPNTVIGLLVLSAAARSWLGDLPGWRLIPIALHLVALVCGAKYLFGGGYDRIETLWATGSVDAAPAGKTESAECPSISPLDPWRCVLPAGHDGLHHAAHPRVKWATADEAAGL